MAPLEEILGKYLPLSWQHGMRDSKAFPKIIDRFMMITAGLGLVFVKPMLIREYLRSDREERDVRFGSLRRQTMDVYYPDCSEDRAERKAVLFCHGGAFGFGHKGMYRLHAKRLAKEGYVVFVPNYRLYPYVESKDQARDISLVLKFVFENASRFRCSQDNIFAMGHSSGACITFLSLLQNVLEDDEPIHCKGAILMSGVYDIEAQYLWEMKRNVHELSFVKPANGGKSIGDLSEECRQAFHDRSPFRWLEKLSPEDTRKFVEQAPEILFLHGIHDKTVPISSTELLHDLLNEKGIPSQYFQLDNDHVNIHTTMLFDWDTNNPVLDRINSFVDSHSVMRSKL